MKVVYDQNRPIYLQIIEKIKEKIVNGEMKPGERMLSINDMAEKMDVNPNTMFRVYKEMERLGIVETKRGAGSFVVEDSGLIERLLEEMADDILTHAVIRLQKLQFSDDDILKAVKNKLTER